MTIENKFSRFFTAMLIRNETSAATTKMVSSPKFQVMKGLFGWQKAKDWRKNEAKKLNEVFISYSRKDKEFIKDLVSDLEKSAFSAWVDWDDIPKTARWREEIREGIEGAHTFIFIISGASVTSDECKKEIDYAIDKNKRVIPVMLEEDVENKLVHQGLSELNYIFYSQTDTYEIAKKQLVSELVYALNTDLNYNRTHARLLVRATEWEKKNNDNSYLLHGKDIEAAEFWVHEGEQKQPRPTSLHKQYIKASRRSASIRSRNLASIISIMAFSAVFAGLKSQANSIRSLIESSEGYLASMLPLEARISSIKAANSFNNPFNKLVSMVDGKLEEQLGLNLTHAVYRDQIQNQIDTGSPSVEALAMSPSGHLIASTSSSKEVKLWDIHGKPKGSIPCNGCSRIMFSADGQKLVALNTFFEIVFWDIRSQFTELKDKKLKLNNFTYWGNAFSANGKRFVALGNDGVIRIWDLWRDNRKPQSEIHAYTKTRGNNINAWRIAVSPDSRHIAVARRDGVIDLWDSSRNNNRPALSLDTLSAITKANNPIFWGDMFAVDKVRFSPDGSLLAALGDANSRVLVWSVRGQVELVQDAKGSAYSFKNLVFSPNGKKIGLIQNFKINWIDSNRRFKTSANKADAITEDYQQSSIISSLIFSRDQKHLLIGDEKGAINILSTSGWKNDNQSMELEHILSAPDSEWQIYLLSPAGNSLIVWNNENPGQYCLLSRGSYHACHVLFSADDSKIREWELNNNEKLLLKCVSSGDDPACQLLSNANDSNFRTWAFNSQESLFRITKKHNLYSITPSAPLSLIDQIRYAILLYRYPSAKLIGCPNYNSSFAISPTGEIANGGRNSFCIWNSRGSLSKHVDFIGDVDQIVYSGNGKVLALFDTTSNFVTIADSDGKMKAKFPTSIPSAQLAPFARPPSWGEPSQVDPSPSKVALNHDGSRLAISLKNTVRVLGPVGQEMALFRLPNDVLAMSFPSDGLRIAIRSPKPTIDSNNVHFLIFKQSTVRSLSSKLCKRNQDYFEYKQIASLCKR